MRGEYYPLTHNGLRISVPEIKMQEGHSYWLKITYYNQYSLYCQYGVDKYYVAAPSQFTVETLTVPYSSLNNEIVFYPEGGNRSIFIADIIIEDFMK